MQSIDKGKIELRRVQLALSHQQLGVSEFLPGDQFLPVDGQPEVLVRGVIVIYQHEQIGQREIFHPDQTRVLYFTGVLQAFERYVEGPLVVAPFPVGVSDQREGGNGLLANPGFDGVVIVLLKVPDGFREPALRIQGETQLIIGQADTAFVGGPFEPLQRFAGKPFFFRKSPE
ncbi:hypothetical protein ACQ86N_38360 [Puia sp. P3]|uniref:hypothetical protein n=1 Tax=Puia sp. P3 TaxID=3423952 RepID=UPI003D674561